MIVNAVNFHRYDEFPILRNAFEKSVKANTKAKLNLLDVEPPPEKKYNDHRKLNNYKLQYWYEQFMNSSEGEIAMMDTDTLVLQEIEGVFEYDFDVAITVQENTRQKNWINAGVLFFRKNEKTEKFFKKWLEYDTEFFKNPRKRRKMSMRTRTLGQNQVSLAMLLKETNCKVLRLPCKIWNSVNSAWFDFSGETKILHVKNSLRDQVFGNIGSDERIPDEVFEIARGYLWNE